MIAVHAFTQESQQHDALQKFEDLDASIQRRESSSVGYTLEVVTLFSQICSRQPRALQICSRMLERAQRVLSSVNDGGGSDDLMAARLFCLLGTVQTMQGPGNYEKAMKSFREATRKDPDSIAALQGMIYCQLCEGSYDDAESQLELMMLMHGEDGNNALGYEFSYLQAMLWRGKKDMKSHLDSLDKCKDAFLSTVADESISNCASSAVYGPARGTTKLYMDCFANLMTLRPDFVMLTAIDYLEHMENAGNSTSSVIPSTSSLLNGAGGNLKSQLAAQNEANNQQSFGTAAVENDFETNNSNLLSGSGTALEISPAVQSGMDLLNRILRTCPGMVSAYVELSRCYSSLGMFEEASRVLQQCLALQPNCSPVLVAMAKVEVSRMNTAAADRVLEQALACDFSIRSASLFRLVKVLVRAQQGRIDEAITEIELIMNSSDFNFSLNLGGVSDAEIAAASANLSSGLMYGSVNYADSMRLTEDDRVSAYVVYASLLGRARRMKEANKVLSHAKVLFAGSKQEVSILVAASQLSVEKNDFDTAIRMLDKISEDSPTYARAQLIKADILLVHNHDKEGFTKCYAQLTKKDPTSKNYALLGEAYLRILNPEAAIDALENAYRLDPSNGRLRGRIGRALVATHEYHRAVEFYETAIRELAKTGDIDTKDSSKKRREGRESFTSSPKNASTKSSQDMIQLSHDLAKLYIKLGMFTTLWFVMYLL